MAKDETRCHRCGGPLGDGGWSWVYARKSKTVLICLCGSCSDVPIDRCLMCKVNPPLAGQPICATCEKAL